MCAHLTRDVWLHTYRFLSALAFLFKGKCWSSAGTQVCKATSSKTSRIRSTLPCRWESTGHMRTWTVHGPLWASLNTFQTRGGFSLFCRVHFHSRPRSPCTSWTRLLLLWVNMWLLRLQGVTGFQKLWPFQKRSIPALAPVVQAAAPDLASYSVFQKVCVVA